MIHCNKAGVDAISRYLAASPSDVIEYDGPPPPTGFTHCWVFNSPVGHDDGDPTSRLKALADSIEPFSERLNLPDVNARCSIDIVYHVTPQHVGGITGEFDWFRCPAKLMSRIAGWGLDVSYECFWFDHPDWKRLKHPWWRTWFGRIIGRPNTTTPNAG